MTVGIFSLKTNWEIGDTAWIHGMGDPHENPRMAGKIVHAFLLPGWCVGTIHYVIEIETPIDPLLAVRQATSMWATEE